MNSETNLPLNDDGGRTDEAISDLATYMQCPEAYVHAAMHGLSVPGWCTPEHQNAVKETTKAFNLALQHAESLVEALRNLSEIDRELLICGGCVTLQQVKHLAKILKTDADFYDAHYQKFPRTGGKNHAALSVAKIVHRVFRIMGKRITWGTREGSPTTDYGRAVQYALASFGVKAGWKQAARVIYDEHERREFETFGVLLRRHTQDLNTNSS